MGDFHNSLLLHLHILYQYFSCILNHIDGVMVTVLALSAVYRGFELQSGQTKDYEIGISCFSVKHAALRRKRKHWLNQIMCPSGAICLPTDCCFSDLSL